MSRRPFLYLRKVYFDVEFNLRKTTLMAGNRKEKVLG